MTKRVECIVTGRVQMVMYRDFTARSARKLGLVGTVCNHEDGSVFVVAEGEEIALSKFILLLEKGPVLSRVENVAVVWAPAVGEYTAFTISY